MSEEINWKEKYAELEKKHQDHKLMHATVDSEYERIKEKEKQNKEDKRAEFMKSWIDNNWKSITEAFAEQMIQMADDTWNHSLTGNE